jgi:hypothetical protein
MVDTLRFNWRHVAVIVGLAGLWFDNRYAVSGLRQDLDSVKKQVAAMDIAVTAARQQAVEGVQEQINDAADDAAVAREQVSSLQRQIAVLKAYHHGKPPAKPLPPDIFPGGKRIYGRTG